MHEQLTETSLMQSADGFFASCSVNPQYRLLTTPIVFLGFTALFSLAMLSLNGESLTVINRRPQYLEFLSLFTQFATNFIIYPQCHLPEPPSEYFITIFISFLKKFEPVIFRSKSHLKSPTKKPTYETLAKEGSPQSAPSQ